METNIENWVKGLVADQVRKMIDEQKENVNRDMLRDIIGEEVRKALDQKKDLMKIEEASEFLGLSKSYLYKKTMTGEIPFYRPMGKIIYFEKTALIDWIRSHPSRSSQELATAAAQYVDSKPLYAK